MVVNQSSAPARVTTPAGLGGSLRQAWVGYQRLLDVEMEAAGFGDRGFPDGRVLRMCSVPSALTISEIGRQLGITRQGAGKAVNKLVDRKLVTVRSSRSSGREKVVALTPRAIEYLAAQRRAARAIERRLRAAIGGDAFDASRRLLDALGEGADLGLREIPPGDVC